MSITTNDLAFDQQFLAQRAAVVRDYRQFVHRIAIATVEAKVEASL